MSVTRGGSLQGRSYNSQPFDCNLIGKGARMRKFKTESKKLLDLMVNSIYTDKDIFLRELISNASDSLDKLYVTALAAGDSSITRNDLKIELAVDAEARTITITDNGIGMTKDELEKNLGTIAHSGTLEFKDENEEQLEDADIIGQFGVGFYSAFMVADNVEVSTLAYNSDEPALWTSDGVEGYTISDGTRTQRGTDITLHIRPNAGEDVDFDHYLREYELRHLVKHYSDYIRYPIGMDVTKSRQVEGTDDAPEYEDYTEHETLNSMVPIWTKKKADVKDSEYNEFYKAQFNDHNDPLRVISMHAEGALNYDVLLFIPAEAPYNLYTKDFDKGLALYSNNVLIMEKCGDLLPDCFGFVRGIVDSPDLSLNISRELLQHDRQLRAIERKIEKKVASELAKLCAEDRGAYEGFFKQFGHSLKYGIYSSYGQNKDLLQDLLMFYSANEKHPITLAEYVEAEKEGQEEIYFASGDKLERLAGTPSVAGVTSRGYDVLLCDENVDEFCLLSLGEYKEQELHNVEDEALDLSTEEEQEEMTQIGAENGELFSVMCDALEDEVENVVPSSRLTDAACCLTASGAVSLGMLKYFETLPAEHEQPEVELTLELNPKHDVFTTLQEAMDNGDEDKVKNYAVILYNQARLAEGLSIEDPAAFNEAVLKLM